MSILPLLQPILQTLQQLVIKDFSQDSVPQIGVISEVSVEVRASGAN